MDPTEREGDAGAAIPGPDARAGQGGGWPPLSSPAEFVPAIIDIGDGFALTRARQGDEQWIAAAVEQSLDHLRPWMEWATPAGSSVEAQSIRMPRLELDWERGEEYAFLVRQGRDPRVLGAAGLMRRDRAPGSERTWEIGYWIHVDWCGRGLATRAARGLTALALRLAGTEDVIIRCDEANTASAAIPRKLGFTLERVDTKLPSAPAETGRDQVWVLRRSPSTRAERLN